MLERCSTSVKNYSSHDCSICYFFHNITNWIYIDFDFSRKKHFLTKLFIINFSRFLSLLWQILMSYDNPFHSLACCLSSDKSDIQLRKAEEKQVSFQKLDLCCLIELHFEFLQQLHHGQLHLSHCKPFTLKIQIIQVLSSLEKYQLEDLSDI